MTLPNNSRTYVGRFAPSPSGNLHFGSLVTALTGYLQAKTQHGRWWLRLDDLDTPRNVPGADTAIQRCLESHALYWDHIYYQSKHLNDYHQNLLKLHTQERVFACACSRKQVMASGGVYSGTCREKHLSWDNHALRLRNDVQAGHLNDAVLGIIDSGDPLVSDDFILRRRDGIIGYHLASVTDDINMGVTEVVRGADLLLPSICQVTLFTLLQREAPDMMHIPVVCFLDGRKLSKQNRAPQLDPDVAAENLYNALMFLGQEPAAELKHCSAKEVMSWALMHWRSERIPAKTKINLLSL
jgi:glutamyl-Q tRNA(Asp) synthetase